MPETNSESVPTEINVPPRKLVCLVIGEEVEASDMRTLRRLAQEIVNKRGDPRGGPYHIWVCEGNVKIDEFALCHPGKKREHVPHAATG